MRIIFVGMHNKPGMLPLDSRTKSGKLIDEIIKKLPPSEILKTNFINDDHIPNHQAYNLYRNEWHKMYSPQHDDIIVLLGRLVQREFIKSCGIQISINHPASVRSKILMDLYIMSSVNKIRSEYINLITK